MNDDIFVITELFRQMEGRVMGQIRGVRYPYPVRRDPACVAYRYLRRFRGGQWHRGGYHVARLNYGLGIAFPWRNDGEMKVRCEIIGGEVQ